MEKEFCKAALKGGIMSREVEIVIENPHGLHARPAAQFVQTAGRYSSHVELEKNGETIDGKSIMGILSLGLECKSKIILRVEGSDENEAVEALEKILLSHE